MFSGFYLFFCRLYKRIVEYNEIYLNEVKKKKKNLLREIISLTKII